MVISLRRSPSANPSRSSQACVAVPSSTTVAASEKDVTDDDDDDDDDEEEEENDDDVSAARGSACAIGWSYVYRSRVRFSRRAGTSFNAGGNCSAGAS